MQNFHRQQRFETHVRCRMAVGDGISIRTARLSSCQLDQIFSRQFSAIDPSSHVRIASAPALLSNPCEIAMLTQLQTSCKMHSSPSSSKKRVAGAEMRTSRDTKTKTHVEKSFGYTLTPRRHSQEMDPGRK